jgi:hypothetical protein
MKKTAFAFILFCCTSLVAAASQNSASPGDPPRSNQQQPVFSLSSGYFSFFGFFTTPLQMPDTTKKIIAPSPAVNIQQKTSKPK